ncbi:1-acyl-sn-glycerol-3-phosphate acyltransferase [hydrocarbon metagenome]|uniref:1-acyl-sn-glycerol-3-phosphate acyltransferase n=1 Tax=hydrocarbon metagenome TaxID=938273 RepID=A0A0W8E7Q2_9ZZZZ
MFYYFIRGLVKFALLFLGLKYEGIHNLPKKGPAIIAANHISSWDPFLVAVASPRPVYFLAKAELYNNRLLAAILKGLHAFPVKRGTADRGAIRKALDILNKGRFLGIFPEGTRTTDTAVQAAQTGAAMLALKSGAELIPVACIGTARRIPWGWGRTKLTVRVGSPMDLSVYREQKANSATLEKLSSEIIKEINLLLSD